MKKLLLLAAIVFLGSTCNNKPQKVITPLIVKNDMKGYALVIGARNETSYFFLGLKSKYNFIVEYGGFFGYSPNTIQELANIKHESLFESDSVYDYAALLGGEIIFPDSAAAVTALNNYLGKVAIYNKYVDSLKQYHHYKQINQ